MGHMGRRKRTHAPGMVFHLVSRLHRRERWFVPQLRDDVASLIRGMIGRTDARLLAYAVMPNHLHIVLRQGRSELGSVMQPLLRRVAHRVQVWHGFEGAVVERRYRDRLCNTPDHVREAIMYVHLNPWRAGLCDADLDYPWVTHAGYLPGSDPAAFGIEDAAQRPILQLFAQGDDCSRDTLCHDYLTWLAWRRQQGAGESESVGESHEPPVAGTPSFHRGDRAWQAHFGSAGRDIDATGAWQRPDVRDYVTTQLQCGTALYRLADLRGSWISRPAARHRARLIRAAAEQGYRTGSIARLFDVSPSTVSAAKYARPAEES